MSFDAEVQTDTFAKILSQAKRSDNITGNRLLGDVHDSMCKLTPEEQAQTLQVMQQRKVDSSESSGFLGLSITAVQKPQFEILKDGHGAPAALIFEPNSWPVIVNLDCPKQQ